MSAVRVMVADDAVLFREGLARVLSDNGFAVVGQAGDGQALLELVSADPPDVVVLDLRMPPTFTAEGLVVAAELRRTTPDVGLMLLSQHVEVHHAMQLVSDFDRGVGYLLKDRVSDLAAFASDIRRVARGDVIIDPELVARLVAKRRRQDPLERLSAREQEVLALMAQGLSNGALADTLHVSLKTVEGYVHTIFTKLDLMPDAREHRRVRAVLSFLRAQ